MNKPLPEVEFLRKILRYEPETGKLFWRQRDDVSMQWNGRYARKEAFMSVNGKIYRYGRICGRAFYAHRVIWTIVNGTWPKDEIDHINGVKTDNRILNLRVATGSQNQYNKPSPKNNTSGVKGVYWCKRSGKWLARIRDNGHRKHLGIFTNIDDAASAYAKAAAELHEEFAYHG